YNNKIEEIINLYVSNILYRIVIDYYRKREMFEFITDNYFFLKQSEILEVENKILKVLNCEAACKDEDSIYCLNRINNIIEKIRQCIGEKQEINVDGFITFRLRMLREDIEKIVDKVVEKYMVEKEYEEFVRLLKYFVDIQECKIEKIIISIEAGSHYIIKDEYGKDLYKDFLKELTGDENDFDINIEDILISGLITTEQKNIIIYGKRNCNNKEFLETIKNVFGDRVTCFDECIEYLPKKILSKNVDMF
ncbi:putative sporulation protein YtxC, partial [Clostridium sp. IBUN22A]|uniref:putative sporulation protein YtxC n=1 Tax=Clostridium sp. IBUN22A TaxID=1523155 RepID=UPI0005FAA34B